MFLFLVKSCVEVEDRIEFPCLQLFSKFSERSEKLFSNLELSSVWFSTLRRIEFWSWWTCVLNPRLVCAQLSLNSRNSFSRIPYLAGNKVSEESIKGLFTLFQVIPLLESSHFYIFTLSRFTFYSLYVYCTALLYVYCTPCLYVYCTPCLYVYCTACLYVYCTACLYVYCTACLYVYCTACLCVYCTACLYVYRTAFLYVFTVPPPYPDPPQKEWNARFTNCDNFTHFWTKF